MSKACIPGPIVVRVQLSKDKNGPAHRYNLPFFVDITTGFFILFSCIPPNFEVVNPSELAGVKKDMLITKKL